MTEPTIREPEQIRRDCARKLRAVRVSEHFQAILGCLLGEDWTTPRLVEMVVTPDGHVLGRCDGETSFKAFLGASADLVRNIHGVAAVADSTGTRWATWWRRWPRSRGECSGADAGETSGDKTVTYDHHEKAGNQGDVVKHVALIAALETILQDWDQAMFRYADTFAGYAYSPIIQGNEWDRGIGRVVERGDQLKQNLHTSLWYEWYLQGRPQLLNGVYPGSSLIANDVCRLHGKKPSLALWDISPPVVANLMETYHGQGHRLFTRPARPGDRSVREADFLFVDPPGASVVRRKDYPH